MQSISIMISGYDTCCDTKESQIMKLAASDTLTASMNVRNVNLFYFKECKNNSTAIDLDLS